MHRHLDTFDRRGKHQTGVSSYLMLHLYLGRYRCQRRPVDDFQQRRRRSGVNQGDDVFNPLEHEPEQVVVHVCRRLAGIGGLVRVGHQNGYSLKKGAIRLFHRNRRSYIRCDQCRFRKLELNPALYRNALG